MAPGGFENIFNKVKSVSKQAADATAKQTKIAKIKMNAVTLKTEKGRHLQTIGIRAYGMYNTEKSIDGPAFYEQVKDEISQLERIDFRLKELDDQIAELRAEGVQVDVEDVTSTTDTTGGT